MIRIRIDVDYQYPSRVKSFICTALGTKVGSDYLKNSKIVARMINESPKKVKAYWFFTPRTIPDRQLLTLLAYDKHEIGLHVANDPRKELKLLEESTGRKVNYYTIHGTARLLARIMWKRWREKAPGIPNDLPLESFQKFPTNGLDTVCYSNAPEQAEKIANNWISKGHVIHIHPIWLFQRGTLNHRGPFYQPFRKILEVDKESETLAIRKKAFFKIVTDGMEYERDIVPTERFIEKLRERGYDIFTFIERKWSYEIPHPPKSWLRVSDNVALLQISSFDDWLKNVGKKTRNMIRKAEKSGIEIDTAEPSEKLAEGIWGIYNETPIRQGRGFPHYGVSLRTVTRDVLSARNTTYIVASLKDELVGFTQLIHGENVTLISQILSLQKHWDKAVNNALVAEAVEVCSKKGVRYLVYGRIGNHPSLDNFKQNNGFTQFRITRYFVPLTRKGKIATKLGLHKEAKNALPQSIKYPLIPIFNWISRNKMKIKLRLEGTATTSAG